MSADPYDFRRARGAIRPKAGSPPAEDIIRQLRDGTDAELESGPGHPRRRAVIAWVGLAIGLLSVVAIFIAIALLLGAPYRAL